MKKALTSFSVYDATIAFPTAFFLFIFMDLGVDATYLSYMYLLNLILIIILEFPTGIISDRYGRKASMIVSNLCFSVSYILVLNAGSPLFVLAHFVFTSLAITTRSGSQHSWMQEFTQNQKDHHAAFQKFEFYGLIGRLLGSLFGVLVYFLTENYAFSICVLLLMYTVSTVLLIRLEETHEPQPDSPFKEAIEVTVGYVNRNKGASIASILTLGSIYILSLPIYMYYPVSAEVYFSGNRSNAIIGVGFIFAAMCLVGIIFTKLTQKLIEHTPDKIGLISFIVGTLLTAFSPLIFIAYINNSGLTIFVLPVICSGVFTVLRTLSNSILTDSIRDVGEENNMSTLMSMFSAIGTIVFSLFYLVVNMATDQNDYGRLILHYVVILPCSLITAVSLLTLTFGCRRKSNEY
jgi:MFS family permease